MKEVLGGSLPDAGKQRASVPSSSTMHSVLLILNLAAYHYSIAYDSKRTFLMQFHLHDKKKHKANESNVMPICLVGVIENVSSS